MTGLLDAVSRLPVWIGYTPSRTGASDDDTANDQRFWGDMAPQRATFLERVKHGALLIFDLGYVNYARFAQMTREGITFITRVRSNMVYQVAYAIERTATVHDLEVALLRGHRVDWRS